MSKKEEDFAESATEILFASLSKLPPGEQDRRLAAFEREVNRSTHTIPAGTGPQGTAHPAAQRGTDGSGVGRSSSSMEGE